jgi:hypothetical protein
MQVPLLKQDVQGLAQTAHAAGVVPAAAIKKYPETQVPHTLLLVQVWQLATLHVIHVGLPDTTCKRNPGWQVPQVLVPLQYAQFAKLAKLQV